jgi:hypothetical protein
MIIVYFFLPAKITTILSMNKQNIEGEQYVSI